MKFYCKQYSKTCKIDVGSSWWWLVMSRSHVFVCCSRWLFQVVAGRMGLLITILLCLVNIFNVINNNSPSVKVIPGNNNIIWVKIINYTVIFCVCDNISIGLETKFWGFMIDWVWALTWKNNMQNKCICIIGMIVGVKVCLRYEMRRENLQNKKEEAFG